MNKSQSLVEETSEGVKIGFSMNYFIPRQAIIYNYFSLLKDHGYVSDVIVFKENQQYHIAITANSPKRDELATF
jgi:hypothetical protein